MLGGVRTKSRWAILPDLELAAVLVVTKYRGMPAGPAFGRKTNEGTRSPGSTA